MKTSVLCTVIALTLTAPLTLAQQDESSNKTPAVTEPSESLKPTIEQMDAAQAEWLTIMQIKDPAEQRERMREFRQKMHATAPMMRAMHRVEQQLADLQPTPEEIEQAQAEWEKIMQTEDPEERHRLMMEYRDKMHSSIELMRAMHQVQQARAQAHASPGAMREMHTRRGAAMSEQSMPMQEMMQKMHGDQGMGMDMREMMQKMHGEQGMMMGMQGMMEAYRQMDKRLDLLQNMLEQLMAEQQDQQ